MRHAALASLAFALCACNPQDTVPPQGGAATAPRTAVAGAPALLTWGPTSTPAGQAFNPQPDGSSGLAFRFREAVPPGPTHVRFGDLDLPGVAASGDLVTATVPADALRTAGPRHVVVAFADGTRVDAGDFAVQ